METEQSNRVTFADLAKVNVNDHVDKKQNLSYLSWAWAVDYMLRLDPDADWEFREWDSKPFLRLPDETCMVYCTVTFGGKRRTCQLPVMDHRNKAIQNPDAFQVNTAMQRALVKAIALHGLGLYIYAGEDLPKDEADAKDEGKKVANAIAASDVKPNADAEKNVTPDQKKRVDGVASEIIDCFNAEQAQVALEVYEEAKLDNEEKLYLWTLLDSKMRRALKDMGKKKSADKNLKEMSPLQA
jgi:hypothetical protein